MAIMCEAKAIWTAQRIKELRERRKESQGAFGRWFRLGPDAVQKWEGGRQRPSGPATLVLDSLEAMTNGYPSPFLSDLVAV